MHATKQQIEALEGLQELDRAAMQAKHELENMPHKQQVLDGRSKRKELQAKLDQVADMLSSEKAELQKLADEDERLQQSQDETQQSIQDSQDDYRRVTSLTRNLQGMAKRRETLEFLMGKARERIAEISKVHDAATQGIAALDKREAGIVAAHNERSAQLAAAMKAAAEKRAQLASCVPEDIMQAYSEALSRCKGVGLGRLESGRCSACRTPIDNDRMLQVRQEAPLATCPSCKRLLIVPEEDS